MSFVDCLWFLCVCMFFMYIFFLFYFLLGLDNMGFYYLIQIKIGLKELWSHAEPDFSLFHVPVTASGIVMISRMADAVPYCAARDHQHLSSSVLVGDHPQPWTTSPRRRNISAASYTGDTGSS